VTAPSAGGEYLSDKFNEFMKEAQVEVQFDNIRQTDGGAAADLVISVGGAAVKYNIYLSNTIKLQFKSSDRSRAELAARLLRLAGVTAEVKKEGGRDVWYIQVTTGMLVTGREELRKVLAKIVREAIARGWVDAGRAEGWLEELEKGRVLKEGWPMYEVGLIEGALVVRYRSSNLRNIEQVAQQLRDMGLVEGVHFSVEIPEEGRYGYVYIRRGAWRTPPGFLYTAPAISRGWRLSS
jgi:hypothetical protein